MNQLIKLDILLKKLNSLLEDILHYQFGIEDKEWINAINTIEEGYALARNFINKRKKTAQDWFEKGLKYKEDKNYEKAINAFLNVVDINPNDVIAWLNLANSYSGNKKHKKAIESLERALEIDPYNAIVLKELGIIYNEISNYDEAIKALKKALELDSTYIEAWRLLGFAYEKNSLPDLAAKAFEKARKFNRIP